MAPSSPSFLPEAKESEQVVAERTLQRGHAQSRLVSGQTEHFCRRQITPREVACAPESMAVSARSTEETGVRREGGGPREERSGLWRSVATDQKLDEKKRAGLGAAQQPDGEARISAKRGGPAEGREDQNVFEVLGPGGKVPQERESEGERAGHAS